MKVVFLEDVQGVANGGEIKEVKNGFARNYLIPKKLAIPATQNSMQRVQKLTKQAEEKRIKVIANFKALTEELDGMQISIESRAGANGKLFGSVTDTIIAQKLSELTEKDIHRRMIQAKDTIRETGIYNIPVNLYPELTATIKLLVHATGTEPIWEDAAEIEGKEDAAEAKSAKEESSQSI
ncbi:MAG: 50S ribosomal protein L9 [Chloroflexi bacterium]|nr:50S ribosomal protein L9 [Chloroflexota bacterium]